MNIQDELAKQKAARDSFSAIKILLMLKTFCILVVYAVLIWLIIIVGMHINDHGLKSLVDFIWLGPNQ